MHHPVWPTPLSLLRSGLNFLASLFILCSGLRCSNSGLHSRWSLYNLNSLNSRDRMAAFRRCLSLGVVLGRWHLFQGWPSRPHMANSGTQPHLYSRAQYISIVNILPVSKGAHSICRMKPSQ